MRVECFGQSRPQDGRLQTLNQDAFVVGRGAVTWMGLCDGAGNAQSVAKGARAASRRASGETSLGQLLLDETWLRWVKGLDSALLGGAEATFVAAAVVREEAVGVCAGDSRAYLVPFDGTLRLLTESGSKARLGSGETQPAVFRATLGVRDVLLLVSDGAWTPLGSAGIERAVRSALMKPFADLPSAVLDAASRRGRADDMTAVALRLMRS
jgi:serine/threonine protein phosphatase PrpC